jgi:hypothetical protein
MTGNVSMFAEILKKARETPGLIDLGQVIVKSNRFYLCLAVNRIELILCLFSGISGFSW